MKELRTMQDKNILISGQVLNSLTEMVEDDLKGRVAVLGVIGISSAYSPPDSARMTLYRDGIPEYTRRLFNIHFRRRNRFTQYLLTFVFLTYIVAILKAAFQFKTKFDLFIGISCFSTFLGVILKWLGIVKKVVYYSIDYYPLKQRRDFEYLMTRAFFILDRFCVRHSDLVWHINPAIAEGRLTFTKVSPDSYKSIHVPIGYGKGLLSPKPFSEISRYRIGFVGTLSPNQGLQMAIPAFSKIARKFTSAELDIIGDGTYRSEVENLVDASPVKTRIKLRGFVGNRKEVTEILSSCALGIAPWTMDEDNNVKYADPGKPKHYAFSGLPIVITRSNTIATEIDDMKAGIAINYNEAEFVRAVERLFADDDLLKEYRENAIKFAQRYIAEDIFNRAWDETLRLI